MDVGQARSLPQHPSTKPLDFYQLTWARAYKLLCSEDGTSCVIGCAHRHGAPRPRGGTAGYRAPEVLLGAHDGAQAYELFFVFVQLLFFLASLLQRAFVKVCSSMFGIPWQRQGGLLGHGGHFAVHRDTALPVFYQW